MYPVVFRVGSFEVSSFGVMVALGALVGLWMLRREARRSGLPADTGDVGLWALAGGLLGAKLLFVAEHAKETGASLLLLERGGLSWFGGLAGGTSVGAFALWRHRLPFLRVFAAATPGLAAGQAIGRIGCLLVGDDYGRPTTLPWGIAFPEGLPPTSARVHPTQVYEAVFLGALTLVLVGWRKRGRSDAEVAGLYLLSVAAFRFLLEFIRLNPPVALGLTTAQWASVAAAMAGAFLLAGARWRRRFHAPGQESG